MSVFSDMGMFGNAGKQDDNEHLKGTPDRCSFHRTGHTQIKLSRRLDRAGQGIDLLGRYGCHEFLFPVGYRWFQEPHCVLGESHSPLSMDGLQLQSGFPLNHLRSRTTPVSHGHCYVVILRAIFLPFPNQSRSKDGGRVTLSFFCSST